MSVTTHMPSPIFKLPLESTLKASLNLTLGKTDPSLKLCYVTQGDLVL